MSENLKEIIEQECTKYVKDVRSQIRTLLKKAMLSLIGLEDAYGRTQIDHCNGRNSVLIDAFRQCAIDEATKLAKNYKPTTESIVRFADAFQKEFNSCFRSEIRTMARVKAKEEAANCVNAIKVDVDKIINQVWENEQ